MHYFKLFARVLFILIICIFDVACKQPNKKTESNAKKEQLQDTSRRETTGNIKDDTIKIKIGDPQILAYSLSQPEHDSLSAKNQDEYDEGYSDFSNELEEFSKHPRKLRLAETASRFIIIADSLVDRKSLTTHAYGLIFVSKTGHFKVFEGGLLRNEIEQESKSFFRQSEIRVK
jgi:hypothetical protein